MGHLEGVYIAKNGLLAGFPLFGRFSVIRTGIERPLKIGNFFGYLNDQTKFCSIRIKITWESPKMAIVRPGDHKNGHNSKTKSRKRHPKVPKGAMSSKQKLAYMVSRHDGNKKLEYVAMI